MSSTLRPLGAILEPFWGVLFVSQKDPDAPQSARGVAEVQVIQWSRMVGFDWKRHLSPFKPALERQPQVVALTPNILTRVQSCSAEVKRPMLLGREAEACCRVQSSSPKTQLHPLTAPPAHSSASGHRLRSVRGEDFAGLTFSGLSAWTMDRIERTDTER